MNRLVILLAAAALAACGNDHPTVGQDGPGPTADAPNNGGSDGGMTPETLTAFVIDLVMNHTNATEMPQPYSAFSSLPDPDGSANNTAAYQSLF